MCLKYSRWPSQQVTETMLYCAGHMPIWTAVFRLLLIDKEDCDEMVTSFEEYTTAFLYDFQERLRLVVSLYNYVTSEEYKSVATIKSLAITNLHCCTTILFLHCCTGIGKSVSIVTSEKPQCSELDIGGMVSRTEVEEEMAW